MRRALLALALALAPAGASASAISVGMYFPFGGDGGFGASIGVGFGLTDRFSLEPRLGYYQLGLDSTIEEQEAVWLDAALLRAEVVLRYQLLADPDVFDPYVLAGPNLAVPLDSAIRRGVAGEEIGAAHAAPGLVAEAWEIEGHELGLGVGGVVGVGTIVYFGRSGYGILLEGRVGLARAPLTVSASSPDGSESYAGEGSAKLDGAEVRVGFLF